jgi:hypothetical protein
MQGTKTYRFYEPDPTHPNRMRELRPFLGGEYSRRYFEQMDELAKDIAELLTEMARWQRSGHPKAARSHHRLRGGNDIGSRR